VKLSSTLLALRTRRVCPATVAMFVACMSGAAGEEVFSFDQTPGRLPKTAIPLHYAIELEPDLENLTLAGSEVIDLDLREATTRLVLNATDITLAAASIDGASANAAIALDPAAQTATLSFAEPVPAGRHKLHINFTGRINKFPRGLFLIEYPAGQGMRRMLASHLEPADARRVFPCWDEPAFKASIGLTVTLPRSLLAISNMPVAQEEPVTPTLKQVTFAATPKMSTYLFVLVAGEFERLSAQLDGTTVSVLSGAGKSEQGRFALASAMQLLRYYNDYFGLKYSLPKLDLIALPGAFRGAMENWGAITFFESRLLFDPAVSGEAARRSIFSVLAHEMAHQWFGNLVTMAWWDNLWLNEGFASWMEAKATEHFFPQWRTWLNSSGAKDGAMKLDARRTAHPIEQPVADESEAMAAFDGITYAKGQALIRMLESYVGKDVFRAGIRRYMAEHAYGNTTTADLWPALEGASGKPVGSVAGTFTRQPGVPLVLAQSSCEDDKQHVHLRQERFTIHYPDAAPQTWMIPVMLGLPDSAQPSATILLGGEPADVVVGGCAEPLKVNLGAVGYYRVDYGEAGRAALRKSFPLMPSADRVNLLADAWALVEAGRSQAPSYFELPEQAGNDDDRAVWDEVISTLVRLNHLARGRPERAALQAYARDMLRPVLDRLGWDPKGREREDNELLRVRLIRVLGEINDTEVIAQARRRFAEFLEDPALLRPSLRAALAHVVGQNGGRNDYEALLALARKAGNATERARYYSAAASARDETLARATLALTLTDELPYTLRTSVIGTVACAGEHPELAFDFVRQNFAVLAQRQGPSFRDYFVASLMRNFSDPGRAAELAEFAPAHATAGGRIMAARAQEAIRIDADVKARVLPQLADWLQRRSAHD
jgi:aminopeptidase N